MDERVVTRESIKLTGNCSVSDAKDKIDCDAKIAKRERKDAKEKLQKSHANAPQQSVLPYSR